MEKKKAGKKFEVISDDYLDNKGIIYATIFIL